MPLFVLDHARLEALAFYKVLEPPLGTGIGSGLKPVWVRIGELTNKGGDRYVCEAD